MKYSILSPSLLFMVVMVSAPALAQSCNAPTQDVVTTINLPSSPFTAIAAKDGCTIFVSMNGRQDPSAPGHIAVLARAGGKITVARDVAVPNQGGAVIGLALSHDGKLLAAANNSGVLLLDVNRLVAGDGKPMVETKDEAAGSAGSLGVAITADDRLLFVSDAAIASITVYDLAKRGAATPMPLAAFPSANTRSTWCSRPMATSSMPSARKHWTDRRLVRPKATMSASRIGKAN